MRVRVLQDVEIWSSTNGQRVRLRKDQTVDCFDHLAMCLIERGKAVAVVDADLTTDGQRWQHGWHVVATLPRLPVNDPRTQERASLIDTCETFFARGCLCLFQHTVGKLKALMRQGL